MAGIGTLVDLLLFYTLERVLFNRMVSSMGKDSQQVKKAMALWLMLEEIGYHDLIRIIHSFDNKTIELLFNEALHCLELIQPNTSFPQTTDQLDDQTPVFRSLFDEPLNYRFFYHNREFIYKRYTHTVETVCDKIFGEAAAIEVDESGVKPVVRSFGEGSSGADDGAAPGATGCSTSTEPIVALAQGSSDEAPRKSKLNPDASEFYPGQDTRTMFLTFSKGYPLSREEIINFFTSNWGEVVEDVFIEHTRQGQDPKFGRIVFTTSLVIPKILNGQAKAKFLINRKHLWSRIYVTRHRENRS